MHKKSVISVLLIFIIFSSDFIFCFTKMKSAKTVGSVLGMKEINKIMKDLNYKFFDYDKEKTYTRMDHINLIKQKIPILETIISTLNDNISSYSQNEQPLLRENINMLKLAVDSLKQQNYLLTPSAIEQQNEILKSQNEHRIQLQNIDNILRKNKNKTNSRENISFISLFTKDNPPSNPVESNAKDLAFGCTMAFFGSVNPSFCFKKGGDTGIIPPLCSCGSYRFLGNCFSSCPENYTWQLGICWQKCRFLYTDFGLFCLNGSTSYLKSSHISLPLDSNHICPRGYYKPSAGNCYRDCKLHGMVNCGVDACANSNVECAVGVTSMAVQFLYGLSQAITFVLSFGTSFAGMPTLDSALTTLRSSFSTLSPTTMAAGVIRSLKEITTDPDAIKVFLDRVVIASKNYIKDTVAADVVQSVCYGVGLGIFGNIMQAETTTFNFSGFDPTGLTGVVASCKVDLSTVNARRACAQSILNMIAVVDKTGLAVMASSLLPPICDI